jgi:hypothetical protein
MYKLRNMEIKNRIRLLIRESLNGVFDEERIPNPEADDFVNKKENFLGSHTYGENIGELNKMYVAYSYGEQHPLFVWIDKEEFKKLRPHEAKDLTEGDDDGKSHKHFYSDEVEHEEVKDEEEYNLSYKSGPWFYNEKPYYVRDRKGRLKPNKWTYKHLKDLKPNERVQARDTIYLQKLISDFKKSHNLGGNSHADLEPGEK